MNRLYQWVKKRIKTQAVGKVWHKPIFDRNETVLVTQKDVTTIMAESEENTDTAQPAARFVTHAVVSYQSSRRYDKIRS